MNNIFKIYKKDIRDIFTNWALLVIIIGLAILPSLYAWFNIKASWNPYGSTSNISVAVINNDKGASINNKEINIGNQVIDKLRKKSTGNNLVRDTKGNNRERKMGEPVKGNGGNQSY